MRINIGSCWPKNAIYGQALVSVCPGEYNYLISFPVYQGGTALDLGVTLHYFSGVEKNIKELTSGPHELI